MKNRGLTLVELMVTLAVISVLLAIAAPKFSSITTGNKLTAKINNLSGSIALARSEAITRNSPVTIAVNNTTTGWYSGWNVFIDVNNDGVYTSGTDTLLKVGESIPSNIKITPTTIPNSLAFKGDGTKSDATAFSLKLCDNSRPATSTNGIKHGREVSVIPSGRYSLEKADCP